MFKFDNKWDVDRAAESLTVSLFGKSKKHKAFKSTNNGSQINSNAVPDSDEEQYSKNDKKRLKKWRKKNRPDGKAIKNEFTNLQQNAVNSMAALSKKNTKAKNSHAELPSQKLKVNTSLIKSATHVENLKNKKFKKTSSIINNTNTPSSETPIDNKSRKRKRSLSVENVLKIKKVKVEENKSGAESTNDVTVSGQEKKKRTRQRKKKNNSKKNKYKHLALNSAIKAGGDVDVSQVNEPTGGGDTKKEHVSEKSGQQAVEPSSSKLNNHNGGVNNNGDFPSKKTVIKDPGILRQDTNGTNNSNSAGDHLLSESKSKKKSASSKPLSIGVDIPNSKASSRNINKSKNNSSLEALVNSSQLQRIREAQFQPIREAQFHPIKEAQLEKLSPATSKVSLKNKRKQKVLLKMLNGEQVSKQATAGEKRQMNLTLKKEKRNVHAAQSGPAVGSINLTQADHITPQNKSKLNQGKEDQENVNTKPATSIVVPASRSIWGKAAELGQQAKEKLNSARFRYINEQLYSCRGNEAQQLFREDQDAYSVYHDGFQSQASKWPINPLDVFIKQIRDKSKNLVIADFGCGEAKLAQSLPHKVHSFDLVALNDSVTACDMSKTPLAGEQVDIAIFCLSLMGTNISDYIREASRVLKTGGLLKIAEVVSRFSGLSRFTDAVCSYGFQLLNKRDINQMFYLMDFKKIKVVKKSTSSLPVIKLKPCIYKRR
jgi:ribosomal RNA-processing protein 8